MNPVILKILIVDDHHLFMEGLRHVLNAMISKLEILEATCAKDGLSVAAHHNDLDLVLLDLDLPDAPGIDVLKQLRQNNPLLPVIILTASDDQANMCQALNLGAAGYIHKSLNGRVLLHIIRLVLAGEIYIPPMLLSKLVTFMGATKIDTTLEQAEMHADIKNDSYLSDIDVRLTSRQREILGLVANGLSNKEIAWELCITEATVKSHVGSVLKVLNVHNRTKAAQAAFKLQSIPGTF